MVDTAIFNNSIQVVITPALPCFLNTGLACLPILIPILPLSKLLITVIYREYFSSRFARPGTCSQTDMAY